MERIEKSSVQDPSPQMAGQKPAHQKQLGSRPATEAVSRRDFLLTGAAGTGLFGVAALGISLNQPPRSLAQVPHAPHAIGIHPMPAVVGVSIMRGTGSTRRTLSATSIPER